MNLLLGFVVAIVLAVIILVPLEGLRQRRSMRRRGAQGTGARMLGAGLLELQHLLQADRHVELLDRQQKREETGAEDSETRDGEP